LIAILFGGLENSVLTFIMSPFKVTGWLGQRVNVPFTIFPEYPFLLDSRPGSFGTNVILIKSPSTSRYN